jgi:hypothetical protein
VAGEPWIGHVTILPDIERKLRTEKFLAPDQVRLAICWGAHDRAVWNEHPEYGRRLVVTGSTDETGPLIAYLRPLDESDGLWECLTAWRLVD